MTTTTAPPADELTARIRRLRHLADQLEATQIGFSWTSVLTDGGPAVMSSSPLTSPSALVGQAVAWAVHGRSEGDVRSLAARAMTRSGDRDLTVGLALARAVAWMGVGRSTDAFETLAEQFTPEAESRTLCVAAGVLAELAVRTGRIREGRAAIDLLPPSPEHEYRFARLILASGERLAALQAAIDDARLWPPLLLGRFHLALGMDLRRSRRARESRAHLMVAVDLLTALGCHAWLDLARNELRAAGVRDEGLSSNASLSPQERAVVELASRGLSNQEIAGRLNLSPRTVGSHLYRVFPKLGVTSRHQLGG